MHGVHKPVSNNKLFIGPIGLIGPIRHIKEGF